MSSNANERKRKVDELAKRMDDNEALLASLVPRVDRLEQRVESSEAYRYVRVENSSSLAELWTAMETEGAPRNELRQRAEAGIKQELKTLYSLDLDEQTLKNKSDALSNQKRDWPTKVARDSTKDSFSWTTWLNGFQRLAMASPCALSLGSLVGFVFNKSRKWLIGRCMWSKQCRLKKQRTERGQG